MIIDVAAWFIADEPDGPQGLLAIHAPSRRRPAIVE
jgi:hypothetical protein